MQVILTPTNGKLAMIVDILTAEIIREIDIPPELKGERDRPYGITKDAAGQWYISNWDRIGVFNSNFELLYVINNLPENIHQIFYDDASDELWVCATSIDSLLTINVKQGFMRRFCLVKNQWVDIDAPGTDSQHFSSVHWYGSHLYVLAHKFGIENSKLSTYDRAMTLIGTWSAGWESHSICRFNDQVFIADSRGGRILGTTGFGMGLGSNYNASRDKDYENGVIKNKYARGMAINDRGIGVTAVFDFGKNETRTTGNSILQVFSVQDKELGVEILLENVGNIQDIQIYSEPEVIIHSDMEKYKSVTDELEKLIPDILANKLLDPEPDRMPYDEKRTKPDFITRLAQISGNPIDYAAQKNLLRLTKGIEFEAEKALNSILPQEWKRSGGFWYPSVNGFMDWHTNCEQPGPRIYFVWCSADGSRFYHSEDGQTVEYTEEKAGWNINFFNAGDRHHQYWHAVDSVGVERISFGFKLRQ